jgi:hypothetical protein
MNPYQPPGYPQSALGTAAVVNRTPFLLAAAGAGLASAYWAMLTLLIALGVATGSVSGTQMVLPFVLIILYAARGYQLYKGDPLAAKRILWLHGVGGVVAIVQMLTGGGLLMVLQGIKVLIHIFGGITAYMAQRAYAEGRTSRV